jgi:O-antigen/teichoic acid export membrane protein
VVDDKMDLELMGAGAASARRRVFARFASLRLQLAGSQLLRRSSLLFLSNILIRLLGFGFSVVAARALAPSGYGVVTYVLALASIGSILLYNASNGLARALARAHDDKAAQDAAFSNYLVVVTSLLLLSLLAAIPAGLVAGLRGWLLVGLLANLLGNAGFQLYVELHRGREHFRSVAVYTVLSNLIQLVSVLSFFLLAWREPAAYVITFGLSGITAIAVMEVFNPVGLRFLRRAVGIPQIKEVLHFVLPLLVHTCFFMVWSGADVVFLKAFAGLEAVGQYGAAKTLANATLLAPAAISTALLPHAARLALRDRHDYFKKLLLLVGVTTIPAVVVLAVGGRLLLHYVYGPGYEAAAAPLAVLAIGTAVYGIDLTLEESWIAIGRPRLAAAVAAVAALITVSTALLLVPRAGSLGAALAYSLGAVGQLVVLGAVTFRFLGRDGVAEPAA